MLVERARVLYDTRVKRQNAVLELAESGARLTKERVAEALDIEPARAGELLDEMARAGSLELDVDESSGEIFYTVSRRARAASPENEGSGLAALRDLEGTIERGGLSAKVGKALLLGGDAAPVAKRRKVSLGVLLGGLFPGFGLAYSAPWPVVIAASAVVIVGWKLISIIPLLSAFLLVPFLVVCALASAALGGMYAWSFNQAGKRAPLGDEPVTPKALMKRLKPKPKA